MRAERSADHRVRLHDAVVAFISLIARDASGTDPDVIDDTYAFCGAGVARSWYVNAAKSAIGLEDRNVGADQSLIANCHAKRHLKPAALTTRWWSIALILMKELPRAARRI